MRGLKKLLIVEGETDQRFVESFINHELEELAVETRIATAPDVAENVHHTSKQGVIQSLHEVIEDLSDGRYTRIGILIDMDFQHTSNTPIKEQNIKQLCQVLNEYGFELLENNDTQGLFFSNEEYDNPIGVWMMPNNNDEGYLETWIENCLASNTDNNVQEHFAKSADFVQSFGESYFKHHLNKANIYTWLATKPKPTQDLYKALDNLNPQIDDYQNFKQWLTRTFSD